MTSAEGPAPRSPRGRAGRRLFQGALAVVVATATVGCGRPDDGAGPAPAPALEGRSMGTTWHLRLAGDAAVGEPEIRAAVEAELDAVDAAMSTWRSDSEVSRFNRADSTDWFPVSAAVASVVDEALDVSRRTDGAFDITVGPLVRRWGFGPDPDPPRSADHEPADAPILPGVGFRHLAVRSDPPAIRKDRPDVEIDLSAIAKGHAVDAVAERLGALGLHRFMIEVGGEVRTRGERPGGGPWRIGIERPDPARRVVDTSIPLRDLAMATSGDYRNFRETDGRRLSHLLDPRTGRPVAHDLAGVTVVAATCRAADAWATALLVLGPDSGYGVAERENLAVLFIRRTAEGFPRRVTPAFERLLHSAPAPSAP